MDFAVLRIFKAVVDEGGINSAARKLHRVQSNVTTRIQKLEASLGAKLFVRHKHRLFLSPQGEVFLGYAEQLLDMSERARSALRDDTPCGVLRIGTLESSAASRLPALLSRYHDRYPEVRVELTTNTTDRLVDAVLGRELEAAFVAERASDAPVDATPAFAEELLLIAPRSHPKIRRAQDVRTDTVIAFPAGCAYRRRLQSWLAAGGVAPEKFLELGSYHAIVACVASGSGIALVPRSVLATLRGRARFSVHPLAENASRITTSLIWRRGEVSPQLRALQIELAHFRKKARALRAAGAL